MLPLVISAFYMYLINFHRHMYIQLFYNNVPFCMQIANIFSLL